ncbi:rhombosortase [Microbulbifer guangxiensis]|uniref:rhombosortase n=1 Tax=Microbulbifer guangxiensis TaxID=2904249 RepID=UPI001F02E1F8|nr:rhombosortase [Microbulbifer guangxiensis]
MPHKARNAIRIGTGPVLLISLICLIHFFSRELEPLLRYDRFQILSGQYWRILTAHFAHINLHHLLLNLSGFLIYWALFPAQQTIHRLLLESVALASMCGIALLLFEPQIDWYVGFSGVLHALVALGATRDLTERSERWRGAFILALISLKVYSETFGTKDSLTESWVGAEVITEAHFWGLICGGLAGAFMSSGAKLGILLLRAMRPINRRVKNQ